MSSNQNTEAVKVKSISTKLTLRVVHQKIAVRFRFDLIAIILVFMTFLATCEYMKIGTIKINGIDRSLYFANADTKIDSAETLFNVAGSLTYKVVDSATKNIIISEAVSSYVYILLIAALSVHVIQAIFVMVGYPLEISRTRKLLKPITEFARKADELTKIDFSEEKYHLIEEKIYELEPDDKEMLSFGDSDLKGIEQAMNNLLLRIRESNKQQARFVNDASHELRTPIAVIEGYANMLDRWGKEDEKVLDESITAIKNESANMKHLVEQLLFLARGDAGRTVVKKEKISLNELIKEVYEESLMIDENHIYSLKTSDEEIYIDADEGLLKQAVRILVDNAAKYTKEKDEIILSSGRDENNEIYLQVQDAGIGMKEADVEHMFERFYRADEARSYDGTGLGLSIAKWIVDKHKGHFMILSREGIGTRIRIYVK